ncbi:MAG: hypothetical protein WC455_13185 [Dehalococcoidia bacterium]
MAEQCPQNPEGGGHYWIIDSRTGLAECRYCTERQQYDIDALIYPDYKERPRKVSAVVVNSVILQFTVDVAMVEDLRMLKVNLQEQLNTASRQAEVYRGIGNKQRDRNVKRSAIEIADRMQKNAGVLSRQVQAISSIVDGPKST